MTEHREYNPEGSLLRRDQKTMLVILDFFADICREHNIVWWMSSGSLLGVARHQGFIPWDDDVDVVLLKKDYRRLEKILTQMENNRYVYQSYRTDVEYINVFSKLRLKGRQLEAKDRRNKFYEHSGLGIDIFAIEKTNSLSAFIAKFLYHNIQYPTSYIKVSWIRRPLIRFIEFIHFYLIFPLLRLIGKINPKNEYHYVLGTGWPKHTFYMENTFPLTTSIFEGRQVPVPKDMDAYLTTVFGDWRKLPSDEQIRNAIHCKEYREDIFGKKS